MTSTVDTGRAAATASSPAPPLDVVSLRADVPALASGLAFFDSPGGTQTPAPVIEAIAAANQGHAASYGADPWTERLQATVRGHFGAGH